MKHYMNMPDTRLLDDWGRPIGKPYLEKSWQQLTPEEMAADFEWKSDILASFGEEVSCDTFYQDYLFHELYNDELNADYEYKVLVTEYDGEEGNKLQRVEVGDIHKFLHRNDVALSPCLFYGNWRNKKLLNYVGAFVMDVDKLRPQNLQRFFMLFEQNRLLVPTFIANSGSGVHFWYVLDKMLKVDSKNEANRIIAEEVYKSLYDDVIKKERWIDAQRHWIGQDYRVVNSKTKLHQTSQIFKVGEIYTIEQLIDHFNVKVDRTKTFATKGMIKYASNIAKDLKIETPDFSDAKETYDFIAANKAAAFEVREARRQQRKLREAKQIRRRFGKPVTWYKNTLAHVQNRTQPGFRFSSMKALAIIAFKEQVPRDVFLADIQALAAEWAVFDWKGDDFNSRNVEAIVRLYDNAAKYSNTTADTLEEWLGYDFRRVGVKRNGRTQKAHLSRARAVQELDYPDGSWRNKDGRPKAAETVYTWRLFHPFDRKADCIRETGLSKPTVYKWWDWEPEPESDLGSIVAAARESNMSVEAYLKEVSPTLEDLEEFRAALDEYLKNNDFVCTKC